MRKSNVLLGLAFLACSDRDTSSRDSDGWQAERDTLGDTVVVRTVSGSVWGSPASFAATVSLGVRDGDENLMLGDVRSLAVGPDGSIYLVEGTPALKKFSPRGGFVRVFGRMGSGPGEYRRPDGGLAVTRDGRVVIRDPGNGRMNVYSPEGEPLSTWRIRSGFNTSRRMYADTAGNLYSMVLVDPEANVFDWVMGLQRYAPDGTPGDTLIVPSWKYESGKISGQREGNTSVNDVPFSPESNWTWNPLGFFVGGVSTAYRIDVLRPGSPLRIERVTPPVPVAPEEAADHKRAATDNMVRSFPGWVWNGPNIPNTKPAYRSVFAGDDGRIWVLLSRPGVKDPEASGEEGVGDNAYSVPTWSEPVAFDVFDPGGQYLGEVTAPAGFQVFPEPVFRGDTAWAVVEDADGVKYVQRLEIRRPAP